MPKLRWGILILVIAACYFPLFLHLDTVGLYRWDESTNALHAMEMLETGDFLIRRYQGQPDHWETKPPLLVWLQAGFTAVLGPGELPIRLPSALAALATLALMSLFFWRDLEDPLAGIAALLALLTAQGYVGIHVTRTGDHDALLIFFLVLGLISAYRYTAREGKGRRNALIWLFVALTGGVMSKSIAGFFYLPGIACFFLVQKEVLPTLKNRAFYLGLAGFVLFVGGYYLLRNAYDPTYLYHVSQNELFHRYLNTAETWQYNVPSDRWYYLKMMVAHHYSYFFWAPILALGVGLLAPDARWRKLTILCGATGFLLLAFVSFGTVNEWYAAPTIPPFAMLTGMLISIILRSLTTYLQLTPDRIQHLFWTLGIVALFVAPYVSVVQSVYKPKPRRDDMKLGNFMRAVSRQRPDMPSFWIYSECNNRHALFYEKVYQQRGKEVTACYSCGDISTCAHPQAGTWVMICEEPYRSQFEQLGLAEIVYERDGCRLYLVGE